MDGLGEDDQWKRQDMGVGLVNTGRVKMRGWAKLGLMKGLEGSTGGL